VRMKKCECRRRESGKQSGTLLVPLMQSGDASHTSERSAQHSHFNYASRTTGTYPSFRRSLEVAPRPRDCMRNAMRNARLAHSSSHSWANTPSSFVFSLYNILNMENIKFIGGRSCLFRLGFPRAPAPEGMSRWQVHFKMITNTIVRGIRHANRSTRRRPII
jgi:hypothetical protein